MAGTGGIMTLGVIICGIWAGTSLQSSGPQTQGFLDPVPRQASADVPEARFAKMKRGLNLSHWWAQRPASDYTHEWLTNQVTEQEIRDIREMGFGHVRLPLDFAALGFNLETRQFDESRLALLKARLQYFASQQLFVMMDLHLTSEEKKRLTTSEAGQETLDQFWDAFAAYLQPFTADQISVEILNEPEGDASAWWYQQDQVRRTIRRRLPNHTIVVSSVKWSHPTELVKQAPYGDANLVYAIHYYDPFIFTHQGTEFGWDSIKQLRHLSYPTRAANVQDVKARAERSDTRDLLTKYQQENWNAERIHADFARLNTWASRYGAKISLGEFGVWKQTAPEDARIEWTRDVRLAAESHGFGWTMWEFKGWFGVKDFREKKSVANVDLLRALGMPKSKFLRNP